MGAKTVSPDTGSSTTFFAASLVGPATGTVKVRVWDSKTKYTEYVDKEKSFTVLSPTGEVVTEVVDEPEWDLWEPGDPKGFGAETLFKTTVQPTDVSFWWADLSESDGITYPDFPNTDYQWVRGSGGKIIVYEGNVRYNVWTDGLIRDGGEPYPVNRLWNDGSYHNFTGTYDYHLRFRTDAGVWCTFKDVTMHFVALGSTFTGQHWYNDSYGSAQGPFSCD